MPDSLDLSVRARRFELFALMRRLECRHATRPRLGEARLPHDEIARFGQDPETGFAASEVSTYTPARHNMLPRIAIRAFGLTGPRGPLPGTLTEYLQQREKHVGDQSWKAFLDIFQHRLICLYYRAWAAGQPVIGADRPHDDPFARLLAASSGVYAPGLPAAEARARLYFSGLLAGQRRPAEGLAKIVAGYFGVAARILPHVGAWLMPEPDDCPRLGQSKTPLGDGYMLGARIWSRQHRFRLILGPLRTDEAARFMPDGRSFAALARWVDDYCAGQLDWQLELQLSPDDHLLARLGASSRIGRTSWLGRPERPSLRITPPPRQRTHHG